jgi:hypothetical protein
MCTETLINLHVCPQASSQAPLTDAFEVPPTCTFLTAGRKTITVTTSNDLSPAQTVNIDVNVEVLRPHLSRTCNLCGLCA